MKEKVCNLAESDNYEGELKHLLGDNQNLTCIFA